jgi:hypothetical protein
MYPGNRIEELLEAILRRLNEPLDIDITIHVSETAGPPTSIIVTPGKPRLNTESDLS